MRLVQMLNDRLTFSFNPRICKRCDYAHDVPHPNKDVSIHASVKDATLSRCGICPYCCGFNPRICKRCDKPTRGATPCCGVSIHASVKDATHIDSEQGRTIGVSIHASVKDATQPDYAYVSGSGVSIHASVKDATQKLAL